VGMFLVTMEARVAPELQERLIRAFDHVKNRRPPGVIQSMLIRDAHDPAIWRVVTIWESHDALEAHYQSGALMPSAYIFQLIEQTPVSVASEIVSTAVPFSAPAQQGQNTSNDAIG
jgi:quinol monooxygenase YgiN